MNGSGPMTAGRNDAGVLALKKIFQPAWIYRLLRIAISVVFIWSGITKLFALKEFSVLIESYGLIPDVWILPAAVFLSVMEVSAGLGLLLDIRGSLSIITGLLILFMAVLSYGIRMGLDIDCGCFGPQDPESKAFHGLWTALVRDMIILPAIFYLYYQRFCQNITPKRLRNLFKIIKKEEDE
jgi:uncharacterized membrane protein YphA (DoxX/SURF4 family)